MTYRKPALLLIAITALSAGLTLSPATFAAKEQPPEVSKDGLHSSLQGFRQRTASLGIVEIPDVTKVPKVKRNILLVLCN